jgi:hypothetical protein
VVLPLEQGFANAELELLTEQDILGDRLVRRKKKRKDADAFLAELSALNPGDLVVHMDHGIGRYEGLEAIKVGDSPHDCVQLTTPAATSSISRSRTSTSFRAMAVKATASRSTSWAARRGSGARRGCASAFWRWPGS